MAKVSVKKPNYCPVCDKTFNISKMDNRTCPDCSGVLVSKSK